MRQSNYSKDNKVVCIQWYGVKFTTNQVYSLTQGLRIENSKGTNSIHPVTEYVEFRKAYKNELKEKGFKWKY